MSRLSYLICRNCGARIGLPHIRGSWQVPPIFTATCPSCGRKMAYSYTDLKDVEIPTVKEYLQRPEGRFSLMLRLLPDFMMFVYGIKQIQEGIVYTLRKVREEAERKRLQL